MTQQPAQKVKVKPLYIGSRRQDRMSHVASFLFFNKRRCAVCSRLFHVENLNRSRICRNCSPPFSWPMFIKRRVPVPAARNNLELLSLLPERTFTAITLRFGFDGQEHSFLDIGGVLGVSTERARQLVRDGLRKLYQWGIEDTRGDEDFSRTTQWEECLSNMDRGAPEIRKICAECFVDSSVVEFRHSNKFCNVCAAQKRGSKFITAFEGYKRTAWWALYKTDSSVAARAATMAAIRTNTAGSGSRNSHSAICGRSWVDRVNSRVGEIKGVEVGP